MFHKLEGEGGLAFLLLSERALRTPSKPFPSSPDPLPAPTLSADPRHDVYYEGEGVTITCSAATRKKIVGFRFFNHSGKEIDLQVPPSLLSSRLLLTATEATAGQYTCEYVAEDSGGEIPSNRSLPLWIKVQGRWLFS